MTLAIEVDRLTKRYDNVTALAAISFCVESGQIMGFLGPNGAGKTTTLRILTGMIAPTQGSVRINGLDVADRSLEVRRQIGYLPESVALYPELRVQEYLAYRAQIKQVPRAGQRRQIEDAMERCAVVDVRRKLIGRLSKGYRQRTALADCLLAHPKVLILDEPTVGLDPHQIRQTRELIRELGQTTTILLSTHILPEVEMICQKVAIIDRGRIRAIDTPERLRRGISGSGSVRIDMKADPAHALSALQQLPGVAKVTPHGGSDGYCVMDVESRENTDVREALFGLAASRGWPLRELAVQRASLEDVFVHLTTQEAS
jgi:ABC-2 type transport system ATP-binding protein